MKSVEEAKEAIRMFDGSVSFLLFFKTNISILVIMSVFSLSHRV